MRSLCYALPLALLCASAQAQDVPFTCSAHGLEHLAPFLQGHPERVQEIQAADAALEHETEQFVSGFDARGGTQYVIPVVFHIIHNNGLENIGDDQIKDAMRILNEDYNQLNPDWVQVKEEFLPIVANVGFTFRLAGYDPEGNCTTGITRTVSALTTDGGQDMKNLIDWPRDMYLNVWVAASAQGAAGYSQTPGNVSGGWGAAADGIVILHNYVGSIGTSSPSHSRALTHEVGHWINLKHCWGGTNDPGLAANCDMDDGVSDTPNTIGWTTCNRNGATCGSPLDNVENYMEYSYCSKMFTNGQKARMIAALNSGTADRNNLWTQANLQATGTADTQPLCLAAFTSDQRSVCVGDSVHFSDASYHGASTWQWSFTGGEPSTATVIDPAVSYAVPGVYPVSLTVGNGVNNLTHQETNYITVLPNTGVASPYSESFEGMTELDPTSWLANNGDGDAGVFSVRTNAGYTGAHSIRMHNNGIEAGHLDELMGPTIDLSNDSNIILSFKYAFARRASTNDDLLRVYVSKDCGNTWILRKQLKASQDLPTVADQTADFTPTNPSQWSECVITSITSAYLVPDFRVKFWFLGDGGNDLWLDDINLASISTGMAEVSGATDIGVNVMPNPAREEATLVTYLPHAGKVRVDLLDVTGRVVRVVGEKTLATGDHRWTLPVSDLTNGIYTVRVEQNGERRIARFVKEQ